MPLQAILIGGLQEAIRQNNRTEYVNWAAAGQISGMIREIKSAEEIVNDMVDEAIGILRNRLTEEVITE